MTIGQYIDDSHSLSFIHSGHFYIAPSKSSTTQRRSRLQHGYCIGVLRRSAQATAGKGLAQGPYMYVAASAGVEPTTLRLKAIVSTKAPSRPVNFTLLLDLYCLLSFSVLEYGFSYSFY